MIPLTPSRPARVLVWDLPTRLFHWLLAASFAGAIGVALSVSHRSPIFPLHMLLGATAGLIVLFRVLWGLVGSRYARFGSFSLGLGALGRYVRGLFAKETALDVGHNPANGWTALAMLATLVGAAVTGALIPVLGRAVSGVHQALAYTALGLVAVHVAGVVLHVIRRRQNVVLGMIDGRKEAEPAAAIRSAYPVAAVVFAGLIGAAALGLFARYDETTKTVDLPVIGAVKLGGKPRNTPAPHAAPAPARARARS